MGRSCGTCRDRRIACDRAVPACAQCVRASRPCKGYGIRLSWPRANDARRAVVARGRGVAQGQPAKRYHVTATSWDIEMHHYLLGFSGLSQALNVPMPFSSMAYDDADGQLLQYFQHTASQCLPILGHDPKALGAILMRMALATSPSATAVRRAILGLSSLHRYGLQSQAVEFKIATIKALRAASDREIGTAEAIQHVAAGMLLCSFEIHRASCTSGQWEWYVTGVKSIISALSLAKFPQDSDFDVLLDWVNYHDALGRFSSLHWRAGPPDARLFPSERTAEMGREDQLCGRIFVSPSGPPMLSTLLDMLVEGCRALSTKQYSNLTQLSKDLTTLPIPPSNPALYLFHLATLVYLNRASSYHLEPPSATHLRVSHAFTILPNLQSCERQFPLLILGCEATTDEQRCTVLALIERTEQCASSRSLTLTRAVIQRVWVQDDLAGGEAGYMDKLSAILGACGIMPQFV
ncbi:hypothetical protein BDW62DRAFT_216928 [Aspergillus aurantiobrunneus]